MRRMIAVLSYVIVSVATSAPSEAEQGSISFRGAVMSSTTGGSSLTLARPPDATSGDLLVASLDVSGSLTISRPAGWTVVRTTTNGTAMKHVSYYRVMAATEPPSYTWAFSKSKPAAGGILAYGGVDRTSPIQASSGTAAGSSAEIRAPSITVDGGGTMLVALFGVRTGTTISPPNGMTERFDVASADAATRVTSAAADAIQLDPGPSGDKIATVPMPTANIGQLVALRPETPPPPSDPPTAVDGSARTFEATPVLATLKARDPEQCQLQFRIVTPPAHGSLSAIDPRACKASKTGGPNTDTATVTYTPTTGSLGSDPFTFAANDGTSDSNIASVTVTVTALPPGVAPIVETTQPVGSMDIADDPAIWVHPTDPASSLVIATSKSPTEGGMYVYDLGGTQRQRIASGASNNVDLRYGFLFDGAPVDLVAASNKSTDAIDLYVVDPAARSLDPVGSVATTGLSEAGLCMYRSRVTGMYYIFTVRSSGVVTQYALSGSGGVIAATPVRSFDAGGQSEGCVADDELGYLYVGEEQAALWRYEAEPDSGKVRSSVDTTGPSGHLVADIEGLGLYYGGDGGGYLIVSSQGESTYAVYRRDGTNPFLGSFRIVDGGGVDGTQETDGLEVSNVRLGPAFPNGMLVVHDHRNAGGTASNYKFVRWEDVAAVLDLVVDTTHDPRL